MESFLRSHARFWGSLSLGSFAGLDLILSHTDQINTLIGAIITIVTVVSALLHDFELEKAKLDANKPVVAPTVTPPAQTITTTVTPTSATPN